MASTKEYLDFVMEQLSGLDEISSRAMMGEGMMWKGYTTKQKQVDGQCTFFGIIP